MYLHIQIVFQTFKNFHFYKDERKNPIPLVRYFLNYFVTTIFLYLAAYKHSLLLNHFSSSESSYTLQNDLF